jgi:hypothetical protein
VKAKKQSIFDRPVYPLDRDIYVGGLTIKTLYQFTPVDELPEGGVYDSIRHGYTRQDLYSRVLSMLANGAISSCKSKFILTKNTLIHHLEADPNISVNSLRGDQYSYIRNMLRTTESFKVLRDSDPWSAPKKGVKRTSGGGIYEVVSPEILVEIERNRARFK